MEESDSFGLRVVSTCLIKSSIYCIQYFSWFVKSTCTLLSVHIVGVLFSPLMVDFTSLKLRNCTPVSAKNEAHIYLKVNFLSRLIAYHMQINNAPINVKPQGWEGGGQTQGNLTFSWKPESNSPPPGTY